MVEIDVETGQQQQQQHPGASIVMPVSSLREPAAENAQEPMKRGMDDASTTITRPQGTLLIGTTSTIRSLATVSAKEKDKNNDSSVAAYNKLTKRRYVFASLIVVTGMAAAGAFCAMGILSEQQRLNTRFDYRAAKISLAVAATWKDYEMFGLWIHQTCHAPLSSSSHISSSSFVGLLQEGELEAESCSCTCTENGNTTRTSTGNGTSVCNALSASPSTSSAAAAAATTSMQTNTNANSGPLGMCSRRTFREAYDYIRSTGIFFSAAHFVSIVHCQEERLILEHEATSFYAKHYPNNPNINYKGFTEFIPLRNGTKAAPTTSYTITSYGPNQTREKYAIVQYTEPIQGNEGAFGLDLLSHPTAYTITSAIENWKPTVTARLRLATEHVDGAYGVGLRHPGVPTFFTNNHQQDNSNDYQAFDDSDNVDVDGGKLMSNNSDNNNKVRPTSLTVLGLRIPDILERAGDSSSGPADVSVVLFDSTNTTKDADLVFLGGSDFKAHEENSNDINKIGSGNDFKVNCTFLPDTTLEEFTKLHKRVRLQQIEIADRTWTVVVGSVGDTGGPFYQASHSKDSSDGAMALVIVGGVIIGATSILLAIFLSWHMESAAESIKSSAEAEKAVMILDTTRKQAQHERQLNDFIAHEVRNPLSSAIGALSFISSAVQTSTTKNTSGGSNEKNDESDSLYMDADKLKAVQEDIQICNGSLVFINHLLKSMLDIHRAANNQLAISNTPTDILTDVLEPVAAILYLRKTKIQVILECNPQTIVVNTDRLRLKQIMVNLAMNAAKFVNEGFIRMGARIVTDSTTKGNTDGVGACGQVQLFVEDSGPGIHLDRQEHLFDKFQESLHVLSQGTGIGLNLCKNVSDLMGSQIQLDNSYHSGVEGCPGTRFEICLNTPNMSLKEATEITTVSSREFEDSKSYLTQDDPAFIAPNQGEETSSRLSSEPILEGVSTLPETFSILFVDDDHIVRKMFTRAVRRVAPGWTIMEAANGEKALLMVASHKFDLIMMDQYMASVEKQLLGSETVLALRSMGITSTVCGLSANDTRDTFLEAGADAFLMKPLPCDRDALTSTLLGVINGVTRGAPR